MKPSGRFHPSAPHSLRPDPLHLPKPEGGVVLVKGCALCWNIGESGARPSWKGTRRDCGGLTATTGRYHLVTSSKVPGGLQLIPTPVPSLRFVFFQKIKQRQECFIRWNWPFPVQRPSHGPAPMLGSFFLACSAPLWAILTRPSVSKCWTQRR